MHQRYCLRNPIISLFFWQLFTFMWRHLCNISISVPHFTGQLEITAANATQHACFSGSHLRIEQLTLKTMFRIIKKLMIPSLSRMKARPGSKGDWVQYRNALQYVQRPSGRRSRVIGNPSLTGTEPYPSWSALMFRNEARAASWTAASEQQHETGPVDNIIE